MQKEYDSSRKQYKTILNTATAEIEEKKSRFIANVKPITREEEALEFVNEIKSKYWNASHNVYAYYIGGENVAQKFSDDGEPSGTAGLPVLEAIKRMELQDLVIVVTRYFGGTQLGAAGLVRTYGRSATSGIEASRIITKKLCERLNIIIDYSSFGKIQNQVINDGYIIKNVVYTQDVEMTILVPIEDMETFCRFVNDATNGNVLIFVDQREYMIE